MSIEIEHAGLGSAYLRSHPDVPIAHDIDASCAYCDLLEGRATPHVHEYRCSCGESCPHVAALDEDVMAKTLRDIGINWAPGYHREFARRVIVEYPRHLRAALDGEQNATAHSSQQGGTRP